MAKKNLKSASLSPEPPPLLRYLEWVRLNWRGRLLLLLAAAVVAGVPTVLGLLPIIVSRFGHQPAYEPNVFWLRGRTNSGVVTQVQLKRFSTLEDCLRAQSREEYARYRLSGYGCADPIPTVRELQQRCKRGSATACLICSRVRARECKEDGL